MWSWKPRGSGEVIQGRNRSQKEGVMKPVTATGNQSSISVANYRKQYIIHLRIIQSRDWESEVCIHQLPVDDWLRTNSRALTLWHLWLVLRTGTPCSCDPKKSSGIELWFFPVNRTLRVEVRAEGKGVGSLPFAAASLPNRSCLSSKGAVCQTTGCSTPDFCLLYIHVTFLFIMTVMWGVTETW